MEVLRALFEHADAVALAVAGTLLAASSVRNIRSDERAAVFRLGRFVKVAGPGLTVKIPYVDRLVIVRLDEKMPYWRSMSRREINEELARRIAGSAAGSGGSG